MLIQFHFHSRKVSRNTKFCQTREINVKRVPSVSLRCHDTWRQSPIRNGLAPPMRQFMNYYQHSVVCCKPGLQMAVDCFHMLVS